MKKIFLIMIGVSLSLMADFARDDTTQVVTDSKTQLQWKDNAIGSTMTWIDAISHCESLNFATHSDWRLPNLRELTSLVDDSKTPLSIDTSVFEYTVSNIYWSSTTSVGRTSYAWYVVFDFGSQGAHNKFDSYYVRCVRAGQ